MSPAPTFSFTTTAAEAADAFADEIRGKNGMYHISDTTMLSLTESWLDYVVLITGTSLNGIGFETALAIAKYASLVVITGYSAERSVVRWCKYFTNHPLKLHTIQTQALGGCD